MYIRKQTFEGIGFESAFLWGARQTGKSTLLKSLFPRSAYIDLLWSSEYERLVRNPSVSKNIDQVCKYILNQSEHHKKKLFRGI